MNIVITHTAPAGAIFVQHVCAHKVFILSVFQVEDGERRSHRPFNAFGVVVCGRRRLRGQVNTFVLVTSQPSRCATSHGRPISHAAIRFMVVVGYPLFKPVSIASVSVLIGTHPQVVGHIFTLQKGLGTGKG